MMFKTETHLHTSETSGCARVPAAEMIALCADAGYTTVFVTDHYNGACFTRPDDPHSADWLSGWRAARAAGERLGVTVLLGVEICFDGAPNDFLVYGPDEDFFRAVPRLDLMGPERFFALANERGYMVIQAHPFRGSCFPQADFVHGIEIGNTNPRHLFHARNEEAAALSEERPSLLRAAGSDAHQPEDVGRAGILTETLIRTAEDYADVLRAGSGQLFADFSPVGE